MGLVLGVLFTTGFYIGCKKIVILKSNYCQGKFHLFFAIEHVQKLKSLVKWLRIPAENEILGLNAKLKIYTHP